MTLPPTDRAASASQSVVFVVEYAEPVPDADGKPQLDETGKLRRGRVVRLDVMERGSGYGESYGEGRAGEWEFARYAADGADITPADPGVSCAACHTRAESRDFVFAGRFPLLPTD